MKKLFSGLLAVILCLLLSVHAFAVNISRPSKYDASVWQGLVSEFGGNCYLFANKVLESEGRPSIRYRFTGGATISGYSPIDGGQVIIGFNRTSISADDVKSIFANTNAGYLVQMYWHWSENSPHTAIVSARDDNGVEFLQANYSAGRITNNYLTWSKLAEVFNNVGNGGGASVYQLGADPYGGSQPTPTPTPTPEPDPINTQTLPDATKGQYYFYDLEGSGHWEKYEGNMPDGINLDVNSGSFSGTPTQTGNYEFKVRFTSNSGSVTETLYKLHVKEPGSSTNRQTLPDATKGQYYDYKFDGNGHWEKYEGNMPEGINLDENSGRLYGTPSKTGDYEFKIRYRSDSGSVTETLYKLHVKEPDQTPPTPAPEISGTFGGGTENNYYTGESSVSGGTSPFTWTVSGNIPDGLSLESSGNKAALKGTLTKSGTFNFTLIVTDKNGLSASKTFSITVMSVPSVNGSLNNGTVKRSYTGTLNVSGGKAAYQWTVSSGNLPDGLELDSESGTISGIPTKAGTFTFILTVIDSNGISAFKEFTVTISKALSISGSLNNGIIKKSYSKTLTATGGTEPYKWTKSGGTLPTGVKLNKTTGKLSGTPTEAGSFTFKIKVTDANGATATKSFTVKITKPVISGTLSDGVIKKSYSKTLTATGGTEPYTWTKSGGTLPTGCKLNKTTGKITGTPTEAGEFTFKVKVTDANGATAVKSYTVKITKPSISGTLSDGIINKSYSKTLTAAGGTEPYTWTKSSGTLPTGFKLNKTTGKITGTPTKAGKYTFKIKVTDANGATATKSYTVTITAPSISGTPGNGIIKAKYTAKLTASGGTSPYTWTVTYGTLPAGLTLDKSNGTISGTPTKAGTFTFEVKAADKNKTAAVKEYTITITSPKISGTLSAGTAGKSYSKTLKATGGTSPYTWTKSSGTLPTGLKLGKTTGKISGTPTKAGKFTFKIKVTDKNGATATKSYTVTIKEAAASSSANAYVDVSDSLSESLSEPEPENKNAITEENETFTSYELSVTAEHDDITDTHSYHVTELHVTSGDVLSQGTERDEDLVSVKANQPLRFILGTWPRTVSGERVYINGEPAEGIETSEGRFTLPAEMIHDDFKICVKAKAGDSELESQELYISAE